MLGVLDTINKSVTHDCGRNLSPTILKDNLVARVSPLHVPGAGHVSPRRKNSSGGVPDSGSFVAPNFCKHHIEAGFGC